MKKMIFRTVLTTVLVMLSASMYAGEPVKYLDGQGQEKYVTDYTVMTGEEKLLTSGWYVVEGGVHEVNHPIRFDGDVHIVLMDKSVLRMTSAQEEPLLSNTEVWGSNALSVYAQSDGLDMGMVENGGVSVSCFSVRGDLTINGGYILWKPKESAEEPCYDIAMTAARLTVNGGVIKTGGYICGISVVDLVLNGGYLSVDAHEVAIAASGSVTFGHSGCEFECDCTNFLYYGDDDMVVDDFVSVQLGDQTYTGSIPYDVTDEVTVKRITSCYDAEAAMAVSGMEECSGDDEAWYSLEGVRLTGRPTKKGVYIHNNRKVIVK